MQPRQFLLLVLALVFVVPAYAAQDLSINGENVSFQKEKNQIEARGSVEVVYKDFFLTGNYVLYNTETQRLLADEGFILHHKGMTIEGEKLDYQIKEQVGEGDDVRFVYQKIDLKGKRLHLADKEITLNKASFTTCDQEQPHYQVTAGDLILYPEYGLLVGYWSYFWFGNIPVLPMPTYIYDVYADDTKQRNLPPFPEVGSNDTDGTYVNQRMAWHLRRELSGTYTINYLSKKGWGGGAEADYIVNERNRGNLRLYGNPTDNYWGGLTHRYFLGSVPAGNAGFYALPQLSQLELETIVSVRERINYERVSQLPNLTLKSRGNQSSIPAIKTDISLALGVIDEESSVRWRRIMAQLRVYGDLPESPLGTVTPFLDIDWRDYSAGGNWLKNTAGVNLRRQFSPAFTLGLGYLHYLTIDGTSPFNFEKYRFRGSDRFTTDWLFSFWRLGLGFASSHYLDDGQAEDLDYSILLGQHCYNIILKYRSMRREFTFGFELVRN